MGSATREARAATLAALASAGATDLATGEQILSAARVIGDSAQLRSVLSDPSIPGADKADVVQRLFHGYSSAARSIITAAVSSPWSSQDDLLAGIEEAGIRVVAASAEGGEAIDAELHAFAAAVDSDEELELALSSKLGPAEGKVRLVEDLLGGKASPQTVVILTHLVRQPRGRRIGALIEGAASMVADEAGKTIATVTTAGPLSAAQFERLRAALARSAGRDVRINHVVDPSVLGGVRVQIGDDVIDGTVASKLNDLKLQLAS